MAMIEAWRCFAFFALGTTSRAEKRAELLALPCCIVTKTALRSLASVALSSVSVSLILPPILSTRIGHLYFGENRTFLLWVDSPLPTG